MLIKAPKAVKNLLKETHFKSLQKMLQEQKRKNNHRRCLYKRYFFVMTVFVLFAIRQIKTADEVIVNY